MLKLKLSVINNNSFVEALNKLANLEGLPVQVRYRVSKILSKVEKQVSESRADFAKIFELAGDKDAEGKVIREAGGSPKIAPEKQAEVTAAVKEFMETEFTIEQQPIRLAQLDNVAKITAADLVALEPILTEAILEAVK